MARPDLASLRVAGADPRVLTRSHYWQRFLWRKGGHGAQRRRLGELPLNRTRVLYLLHRQQAPLDAIASAFSDQGFICGRLASAEALLELVEDQRPDVIIMDWAEVDADHDLIAALRSEAFGVRIFLMADNNPEAPEVVRAVRAGAVAVFVKPFQPAQMIQTVSEELREDLRAPENAGGSPKIQGLTSLTGREREVLRHIVAGRTNREAAEVLGISPRTIEVHRAAAMRKLGARNTAEMIRIALRS